MPELNNRIALVTGGSRGIGKAIALVLANAGAGVAVNYRERAEEAASVVEAIQRIGSRAVAIAADVSIAGAVQSMISSVEEQFGPIDILVNNAGVAITRGIDDITEEDFDRTIAVNLKSAFLCTQAVLSHMRARRWGRIVNISSIGARIGAGSVSVAARIPVGRIATGDEIAQAVLLLVQDAYITGQTLAVNGGALFS